MKQRDKQMIQDEQSIVWLEDPSKFFYVREVVCAQHYRKRKPGKSLYGGRLIGYTTLKDDAKGNGQRYYQFERRCFVLFEHDASEAKDSVYNERNFPTEGVPPSEIAVGVDTRSTRFDYPKPKGYKGYELGRLVG